MPAWVLIPFLMMSVLGFLVSLLLYIPRLFGIGLPEYVSILEVLLAYLLSAVMMSTLGVLVLNPRMRALGKRQWRDRFAIYSMSYQKELWGAMVGHAPKLMRHFGIGLLAFVLVHTLVWNAAMALIEYGGAPLDSHITSPMLMYYFCLLVLYSDFQERNPGRDQPQEANHQQDVSFWE